MAGQRLSGFRRNARAAQIRNERLPQRVEVGHVPGRIAVFEK